MNRHVFAAVASMALVVGLAPRIANAAITEVGGTACGGVNQPCPTSEFETSGQPGYPWNGVGSPWPATTSYVSGQLQVGPGNYLFQYWGSGNSGNTNSFLSTTLAPNSGGGLVVSVGVGGTGAGSVLPSFTESFTTTTDLSFTFSSLTPGNGTCSISNGGAANPLGGCAYVATTLGGVGYLGFADSPYPADFDFQDLAMRISAVPEPATMAVLGFGLAGLMLARRRRAD